MTGLVRMFDASASIPTTVPPGFGAVAGYIGGDTPHVWTPKEWQRFSSLRQFPIWVDDQETADPIVSGTKAAAAAKKLGWRDDHSRAIVLDIEQTVKPVWVSKFSQRINTLGYLLIVYGAGDFVAKVKAARNWVANGSVNPGFVTGQYAVAYQVYFDQKLNGGVVDISIIGDDMLKLGGVGARKG